MIVKNSTATFYSSFQQFGSVENLQFWCEVQMNSSFVQRFYSLVVGFVSQTFVIPDWSQKNNAESRFTNFTFLAHS